MSDQNDDATNETGAEPVSIDPETAAPIEIADSIELGPASDPADPAVEVPAAPVLDAAHVEAPQIEPAQAPSASAPPSATGNDMITRLRLEADACEDPTRKAVLLHEAAELEERAAGDDLGAAREYLAAFNLENTFREPLEALVRILERRRSLKNLGRVLDSLSKSAETSEERARSLRALAADAIDVKNDRDGARDFLEQAVDADASDQAAWLMLEIDAALRNDGEARRRALARRVELSTDHKWAGLLRVDLAEEKAQGGEVDDALDVLVEVVTSQDEAAFRACEVAERLARKGERQDREAWALVQRAEIILESLAEPITARGRGVPRSLRRGGVAADAFVRAAASYRGVGRIEDELATLERAIAVDPDATMPHLARIAAATRLGDLERASDIARALLARSARPELAPHLWLAVAEAALARGERDAVIEACSRLMETAHEAEQGRTAAVPKTLTIDLLLDGSDPGRLAQLLEADAGTRPTPEGRARGYLIAATVRALFAGDAEGAKAALAQAEANGESPAYVARLALALAGSTPVALQDTPGVIPFHPEWYEEAANALRTASRDPLERSDLDLEIARLHLARGDRDGAREALQRIADDAPHALLARVSRLVLGGDAAGDALLARLAEGLGGDAAIAFAVARAVRANRHDEAEARTAAVAALAAASEEDSLAAFVRAASLAGADPRGAASVLRELSRTEESPELRDVLRVASAFLLARASDTSGMREALDELESDAQSAFAPARAAMQRLLAKGDDEARRAAVETSFAPAFGPLERAVERIANPTADGPGAEELLSELLRSEDKSLSRAALLLQVIWPDGNVSPETKEQALGAFEGLGSDAARQIERAALRRATRDADAPTAIIAAEGWHRHGGGVPAALDMMIAAEQANDADAEVRARLALASSLQGAAADLVGASASLVAHVANLPAPAVPTAREPQLAPLLALARAELAPPGADPTHREVALRGISDIVEHSSATLHEMAAWSALARNDFGSARALFARALELAQLAAEEPRSALEGAIETELLAHGGRPTAPWAELIERLARHVEARGDGAAAAELWEQVGHAWWDHVGDPARGERALAEAFARDNHRQRAFDRVFRAVRGRKDDDRLLQLVQRRLEVSEDPPEMAKLFWEQARVLRAKGDKDGALSSLENVTMLEPDHVGALALSAEIYVGRQQYDEAAAALDKLSRQNVPPQQKLGAGLGAADIYESKLDRPEAALDVLVALDKSGLSDVAIHERIARAAARAEAWVPATTYLTKLIRERQDPRGRIEAARLCAAIFRDRMDDPTGALPALVALLREAPNDLEAAEQFLDGGPSRDRHRETLNDVLSTTVDALQHAPADARLTRIATRSAAILELVDLTQTGVAMLVALGAASEQERHEAAVFAGRLGTAPAVALDPTSARRLWAPEEVGPILDLFRLMGPTIAEALGPTLEALGVGRRERVDARAGSALRNEIAAWAGALGIAEFELYVGGRDQHLIQGVPGEVHSIVVGSAVRTPLSLVDRARLVRELVAMERGTTIALVRDDVAMAAVIVASCALGDVQLQTPAYSVLAETQRMLSKAIARKTKKLLPEAAQAVSRSLGGGGDLRTFRGHALRTLDRAAAVATGDPGAALVGIVGENAPAPKIAADGRATAMLRFVWSDDYFMLRKQLGLGIG